jgi:hypothetical protein
MDSYNSPYQPRLDKQEFQRIGLSAGRNILEKTIIYGTQLLKFIIQFAIDAIKAVFGRS